MTRDEVELTCKNVRELGQLVWEADKLQANDAEQRAMIDEQVEENRGLRADVLLMQKANAEQREEIEQARKTGNYWKMELQEANKEITRLREAFYSIIPLESIKWSLAAMRNTGAQYHTQSISKEALEQAEQALTQEPT